MCGGGHPEVCAKRRCIPAGNGGAVMVHHQMLPYSRQYLDDRECHCSTQESSPGIGSAGGGGFKCKPGQARGILEGGGDNVSADGGGVIIHVIPLPPLTAPMIPGRKDVDHGPVGEGGVVPDRIHPGDR